MNENKNEMRTITYNEIQTHRSSQSCWIVLYGQVYDVTAFLPHHPGSTQAILRLAGSDATEQYDPIHPPGTLEANLAPEATIGTFDASTLPVEQRLVAQSNAHVSDNSSTNNVARLKPTSLEECLNLDDIECFATRKLSRQAWGYYYSGGDDLISKHLNTDVYRRILLRPRVFIDCTRCDTSTRLLQQTLRVDVPFFVAPAAMARLGHRDGEHGIAQACGTFGAMQIISNSASQTPEQIVADAEADQVFGWQIYVKTNRKASEDMLQRINRLPGIKFVCLTLDAPVLGKREDDERSKSMGSTLSVINALESGCMSAPGMSNEAGAVDSAPFAGTAPDLTWTTTLCWLRKHTNRPIILKGIQSHEDAYIASLFTPLVKGIILSKPRRSCPRHSSSGNPYSSGDPKVLS